MKTYFLEVILVLIKLKGEVRGGGDGGEGADCYMFSPAPQGFFSCSIRLLEEEKKMTRQMGLIYI